MKKVTLIMILIMITKIATSKVNEYPTHIPESRKKELVIYVPVSKNKQVRLVSLGFDYQNYLNKIAKSESKGSGDYKAINQFGFLGKYQFDPKTLRGLGYTEEQISNFLDSPEMQEEAMFKLTQHNKQQLKHLKLLGSVGDTIGGVKVSMEGLLAGAHLKGSNAVRLFIQRDSITYDGNGKSIKDYIKMFE